MKHLKLLILSVLITLVCTRTEAQNSPFLGISSHFVNFETSKYFPGQNWQSNWALKKFLVGIPVGEQLSVMPTFSFGKANATGLDKEKTFWNLDANLKYDFTQTRLQPYAMIGAGTTRVNETSYGGVNAGLGLTFWIHEVLALNAQTNYNAIPSFKYLQNSFGIVLKLDGSPKDSDKDGIPDDKDLCPKVAGPAGTQGCPDSDGDGVKDSDDQCPNLAGPASTFGCPDSDGDGVKDSEDKCPNQAGKSEFNGCPDSDNDGIVDSEDNCPNEAGTSANKGCPDSDDDGVIDSEDSCPQIKGPVATKGCPDGDGDGIADKDDKCPAVAGVLSLNGCPEINEEEKKQIETQLNLAAKLIQFETGKAVIRQQSYKEIDEIISIMNQHDWTHFNIEGHTDNTGNAIKNTQLSELRANAVKSYIVQKGIEANRLTAAGFGSERPVATNATAAGRTQNRRVEIHLKQ